jgi:hypothetical protein
VIASFKPAMNRSPHALSFVSNSSAVSPAGDGGGGFGGAGGVSAGGAGGSVVGAGGCPSVTVRYPHCHCLCIPITTGDVGGWTGPPDG